MEPTTSKINTISRPHALFIATKHANTFKISQAFETWKTNIANIAKSSFLNGIKSQPQPQPEPEPEPEPELAYLTCCSCSQLEPLPLPGRASSAPRTGGAAAAARSDRLRLDRSADNSNNVDYLVPILFSVALAYLAYKVISWDSNKNVKLIVENSNPLIDCC